MDLYEYQAKDLFAAHGVPVLPGKTVETPEDAAAATTSVAAREDKRRPIVTVWQVVGGVFGALVLLLIVFLLLFDWDWLRGPIGRFASAKAHRGAKMQPTGSVSGSGTSPAMDGKRPAPPSSNEQASSAAV